MTQEIKAKRSSIVVALHEDERDRLEVMVYDGKSHLILGRYFLNLWDKTNYSGGFNFDARKKKHRKKCELCNTSHSLNTTCHNAEYERKQKRLKNVTKR